MLHMKVLTKKPKRLVSFIITTILVTSTLLGQSHLSLAVGKSVVTSIQLIKPFANSGKKLTSTLTMKRNSKFSIKAKALPSKASNRKLKYTSNKKKVATVSKKGVINAKKVGKANVVVVCVANKNVKAIIKLTVVKSLNKVKKITLNKTNATLYINGTNSQKSIALNAKITSPKKPTNKKLVYFSSNKKVAEINNNGVVTAKAKGSAKVMVAAGDGQGAMSTCNINVKELPTSTATKNPVVSTSPDLGTPDPVTPDPGTPEPGTSEPGTPAPSTPDPGTPDPGTPDPSTPDPRFAIVDFENDTIGAIYSCTEGDTKPTVAVAQNPANAGGKSLQITNNGYNQAAIVPINLLNELQNYESFSFNFSLKGGTSLTYKKIMVYIADSQATFVKWGFGNPASNANQFASNLLGSTSETSFTDAHKNVWTNFKITISNPGNSIKNIKGQLYLAIGINHNDIDFLIDDLTFTLKEDITTPSPTPTVTPTPSPTPIPVNISDSSSVIFYENFEAPVSTNITNKIISGMSNGTALADTGIGSTSTVLSAANAGRPLISGGSAGAGIRLNSYTANDYVQLIVENTTDEEQNYLFSFDFKYAAYGTNVNPSDAPTLPLQVISVNPDNTNEKHTWFDQNVDFVPYSGSTFESWFTFLIPFEIPAHETVNLQISQTSNIPTTYVRLFMDNFSVGCIDNTKVLNIVPDDVRALEVDLDTNAGETVKWLSKDTSVATVNTKGEVTAIATGKTYIIAKIYDSRDYVLRERVCVVKVSQLIN